MKKTIMHGEPPYLPEEIIRNILKRLPVKSLIRFQCVCKNWKNLFKTSSFIADNLRHSHQSSFLLFHCYRGRVPYEKYDPLHLCLVDRQIRVRKVQNAPQIPSMRMARIVDSSNGLLCVRICGTNHSFLLCNLAIREVIVVPKPLNPAGKKVYQGFGFSPIVNDYRIVRLHASFLGHLVYRVEVFSLSTGSWKDVEVGKLDGVTLMKRDSFTKDGAIFWFGSKPGVVEEGAYDHHLIVSFDIALEVFTLIPMPPIYYNSCANFSVYENKLAVLSRMGNSKYCLIGLWVMEEDTNAARVRERWSWTKKYTSNPYPCFLHPRTIWRNEIVCRVDATPQLFRERKGKTVLINLTTNEFNMFAYHRFGDYYRIFNHVESLVPVDNIPHEEV